MIACICLVGSSIIRHFEASRSWSLVPEETPDIQYLLHSLSIFYPYLCWEQEAIEPKLKNLESPSQCLSLALVLRFYLLLPPSLPFWKVELEEGTGYVRSPKAYGSSDRYRQS